MSLRRELELPENAAANSQMNSNFWCSLEYPVHAVPIGFHLAFPGTVFATN